MVRHMKLKDIEDDELIIELLERGYSISRPKLKDKKQKEKKIEIIKGEEGDEFFLTNNMINENIKKITPPVIETKIDTPIKEVRIKNEGSNMFLSNDQIEKKAQVGLSVLEDFVLGIGKKKNREEK